MATKKAAPKKAAPKQKAQSEPVVYRSRNPEPREFPIMGIRARRDVRHPEYIEWELPDDSEFIERFARHPHVAKFRAVLKQ